MRRGWLLFVTGWLPILGGSWLASAIQTGGGYSGGAAFSNGFGGPDGLKYLRGLPLPEVLTRWI